MFLPYYCLYIILDFKGFIVQLILLIISLLMFFGLFSSKISLVPGNHSPLFTYYYCRTRNFDHYLN
jgi:hypothetical protein